MAEIPEIKIEQLQPIDFGPSDKDRMKDLWSEIFIAEYKLSRAENSCGNNATRIASLTAHESCKHFRQWLDVMEVVVNDPAQ